MVKFTEIADQGLASATESPEQAANLRASIRLHLSNNPIDKSAPLAMRDGKHLYVFSIWKVRVTWQALDDGDVLVWSVERLRQQR